MAVASACALEVHDLSIRFGGHTVLDGVSCRFQQGTVTAIVGPNGAGKTTFFNAVSGQLKSNSGHIKLFNEDITGLSAPARAQRGIGRAFQLTNLFPGLSVFENMRLATAAGVGGKQSLFARANAQREILERTRHWLDEVSMAHRAEALAATLSHGEQRKLEVGLLLALEPKIFMLDEPTSGMSVDEVPMVLDLVARLSEDSQRTVLLVEHKMDVVHALAERIVVLHQGELVADGPPADVMASTVVREAYLGTLQSTEETSA